MAIGRSRILFWSILLASSVISNRKTSGLNKFKSNVNNLKIPSFKNVIEVKSTFPGRVRFYIPVLKSNIDLANHFISQIKQISVIKKCEVNIITGSALIEYDSDSLDFQTLEGAIIKLLNLDKFLDGNRKSCVEKEIMNISQAVDNGIYDYTNGILNAKTLLALGLLSTAVYQVRRYGFGIRPDYLTLMWWTKSIFA